MVSWPIRRARKRVDPVLISVAIGCATPAQFPSLPLALGSEPRQAVASQRRYLVIPYHFRNRLALVHLNDVNFILCFLLCSANSTSPWTQPAVPSKSAISAAVFVVAAYQ